MTCGIEWSDEEACQSQLEVLSLETTYITRDGFIKLITTINTDILRELTLGNTRFK